MNGIEWWTNTIRYDAGDLGYVMLQLPKIQLPPLSYSDVRFEPKEEIHCSLVCIPKLAADRSVSTAELYQFVKNYAESQPIHFKGFGKQLYVCENEGARSIVATAKAHGVHQMFESLRLAFPVLKDLPNPSLHVTLYKYNHRYGIGIQSDEERERLCRLIPETELKEVRKAIYELQSSLI